MTRASGKKPKTKEKPTAKWEAFHYVNHGILVILALMMAIPFYSVFSMSFSGSIESLDLLGRFIPRSPTLDSYKFVLDNTGLLRGLRNTTIVVALGVPFNLILTLSIAYSLSKRWLFVEAYRAARKPVYLETARRALDFYYDRDLSRFECTAGALDTVCVDKETSGPLIAGALMLYEETGNTAYLSRAEDAAYYFCSWMYHYQALYAPESDFQQYGFNTTGGTAVSTQHHHIDPWGAYVAGWLLKLACYTNNGAWRHRADLLYANTTQCVARTAQPRIHNHARPLGSQNEAFYHCRWAGTPGDMNDWLVAWPGAFRLYSLDMASAIGMQYR